MPWRPKALSGLLLSTALALTLTGVGGGQVTAAGDAGARPAAVSVAAGASHGASAGHSAMSHTMSASTMASGDDPDGDGYIMADPPVTGVVPSTAEPPHRYFHEFQAKCAPNHTAPDDPIVFPGQPGKSHDHTFMGNTLTNADTTMGSLDQGGTSCNAVGDKSAYWMPSLYDGDRKIMPIGPQTIYYKAGVTDYTSVRPFPKGLRFVVGSPMQSKDEFQHLKGTVEGWECGESYHNWDFPASCPTSQDTQLNIRLQAPSCWDGIHLDTPDHQSHMAYPVASGANYNGCPADHPVALPMIEFKMAWPVNGDMSQVRLASGAGFSFHYDFMDGWDAATLQAMVTHCINHGLQCDDRGYDQSNPQEGPVLNDDYELP